MWSEETCVEAPKPDKLFVTITRRLGCGSEEGYYSVDGSGDKKQDNTYLSYRHHHHRTLRWDVHVGEQYGLPTGEFDCDTSALSLSLFFMIFLVSLLTSHCSHHHHLHMYFSPTIYHPNSFVNILMHNNNNGSISCNSTFACIYCKNFLWKYTTKHKKCKHSRRLQEKVWTIWCMHPLMKIA